MVVGQFGGTLDKVVKGRGFGQMDGAKLEFCRTERKRERGERRWEGEILIRRGESVRQEVGK